MQNFINNISNNPVAKLLIILLVWDVFLGSLRAIKQREWNSTVGINGLLRKAGMIGSILFLSLADSVMSINLIKSVPEEILAVMPLKKIGVCEFFGTLFILYEATSVLKNMSIVGLPVSKKATKKLQELLKKMTSELDDKKLNNKK